MVTNTAFSIWLSLICATYVVVVAYTFLLLDDGKILVMALHIYYIYILDLL